MIEILADDLTGALDAAAAFTKHGASPFVSLLPGRESHTDAGVVSHNMDTRRLPADEVAGVVRRVTRERGNIAHRRRFLKIDSTLRGHPGAESDAVVTASHAAAVVVAPSFPANGRVVLGGRLLVHGVPIAETEVGKDPLSPVANSRVASVLSADCNYRVAEIGIDYLRSGRASRSMSELLEEEGGRPLVFCCDAETDGDLDSVLSAGLELEALLDRPTGVLFAGSAGLASALARQPATGKGALDREDGDLARPQWTAPVLLVTASQRMLVDRQLDALVSQRDFKLHTLLFEVGPDDSCVAEHEATALAAKSTLASGRNAVVRAKIRPDLSSRSPEAVRSIADSLTARLGEMTRAVVQEVKIGGLALIGGDSALAVLSAVKTHGISLSSEPLPGVTAGSIEGGLLDGTPVATKAGAFGDDETMSRLLGSLMAKDRPT